MVTVLKKNDQNFLGTYPKGIGIIQKRYEVEFEILSTPFNLYVILAVGLHERAEWQRSWGNRVLMSFVAALQKRICLVDNCISHQNCNCWHGFMERYFNSPLWQPAMGNTVQYSAIQWRLGFINWQIFSCISWAYIWWIPMHMALLSASIQSYFLPPWVYVVMHYIQRVAIHWIYFANWMCWSHTLRKGTRLQYFCT